MTTPDLFTYFSSTFTLLPSYCYSTYDLNLLSLTYILLIQIRRGLSFVDKPEFLMGRRRIFECKQCKQKE